LYLRGSAGEYAAYHVQACGNFVGVGYAYAISLLAVDIPIPEEGTWYTSVFQLAGHGARPIEHTWISEWA